MCFISLREEWRLIENKNKSLLAQMLSLKRYYVLVYASHTLNEGMTRNNFALR